MLQNFLAALAFIALFLPYGVFAEDRYPEHIPEWIWAEDQRYKALVSTAERISFYRQMSKVQLLKEKGEFNNANEIAIAAYQRLHTNFSVRDLARGAPIIAAPSGKARAAVLLDPKFPLEMAETLESAISLVLEHCTDQSIVEKAMAQSIAVPQPFPTEADGADFRLMIQSIVRPASVQAFVEDLSAALTPTNNQPPLIIVSSYTGNPWWGGGFYDSYRSPRFTLTRLGPEGYFYIRLNTDRMTNGAYRVDSPNFWAGKIAHEMLHNLGYWHPPYRDPDNRDNMNPEGKKAFLYAYEVALIEFLDTRPN